VVCTPNARSRFGTPNTRDLSLERFRRTAAAFRGIRFDIFGEKRVLLLHDPTRGSESSRSA